MTTLDFINNREQSTRLKKLTVRAWWADGLWDFAMAGFYILLAIFIYYMTYDLISPNTPPPWPLNLQDANDAWQRITLGWILGSIVLMSVYVYLTFLLVKAAKRRWIAPIAGDVRHTFWLPIETRAALLYLGIYIILSVALLYINERFTGGSRVLSVFMITAPAAVFFSVGQEYWLKRYIFLSAGGFLICLVFEWLFAGELANIQNLPPFLQSSSDVGNPLIPLLIWAGLLVISGFSGLYATLRGANESSR